MFKCPNFSTCGRIFSIIKTKCNHSKNCGIVRVCNICHKKFMSESGFRKHTKPHTAKSVATILQFTGTANNKDLKLTNPTYGEDPSSSSHMSVEDDSQDKHPIEETFPAVTTESGSTSSPWSSPGTGIDYILKSIASQVDPSTSSNATSTCFGDVEKDLAFEEWLEKAAVASINLRKTIAEYEKKLAWYVTKANDEQWEAGAILGEEIVNGQTLFKIRWKPIVTLQMMRRKGFPRIF